MTVSSSSSSFSTVEIAGPYSEVVSGTTQFHVLRDRNSEIVMYFHGVNPQNTITISPENLPNGTENSLLSISKVKFDIQSSGRIDLVWDGNTPKTALPVSGNGVFGQPGAVITNNADTPNGNLEIQFSGFNSDDSYNITLFLIRESGFETESSSSSSSSSE